MTWLVDHLTHSNIIIALLGVAIWFLFSIRRRVNKVMANIADLTAKVAELTTVEASAEALLDGLSQQLKDAKGDPAAIQTVIDSLDAGKAGLADAVARNTPASGNEPLT